MRLPWHRRQGDPAQPEQVNEPRDAALEEYRRGWLEADRDRKAAFRQLIGVEMKLDRQMRVNEDRKRQIGRLQRQLRDFEARKDRQIEDLEAVIGGLKDQLADLAAQLATARASALVPSTPIIPERDYGAPVDPFWPQYLYTDPSIVADGVPLNGVFAINGHPSLDKPV